MQDKNSIRILRMVSCVICPETRSASNEWRKDERMRRLYSSNKTAGNWDITVYNKDNRHLCSATNSLVSKIRLFEKRDRPNPDRPGRPTSDLALFRGRNPASQRDSSSGCRVRDAGYHLGSLSRYPQVQPLSDRWALTNGRTPRILPDGFPRGLRQLG